MPWLLLSVALFCNDLSLPLDDEMRNPTTFADKLTRDAALYMVQGLTAAEDAGDSFEVPCRGVAQDLLQDLASTLAVDGTLDPGALRRVYEARYHESSAVRGQEAWVPQALTEFAGKTGYKSWPSRLVERSMVKRLSRRIYRSPAGFEPAFSVAETLDTAEGDANAAVRETELGIQRPSGDWDFYVYDHTGRRAKTSTFPVGERPSPTFCISCHYDGGDRRFSRFFRD